MRGRFTPNLRQCDAVVFEPLPKLTVVLLSKKLTLKEDRLATQIKCRSEKTKSQIRIFRRGSKTTSLSTTISTAQQARARVARRSRVAAFRLPRIHTEFEINVNAKPQGLSKNG
jgi:hypothetical protein